MNREYPLTPLRVLLVEDSVYDCDAFRRAFKKSDMTVELSVSSRAEEALLQLETETTAFDLVVSDHNLPGMSGLEFCREIIRRCLPLPTVLLTGGGSEHLAVDALKSGVSDYLMKDPEGGYLNLLPVVLPEVVKQYHERLSRQRAEAALRESEEQFRHAFEYTAVGMALMTIDGHFLQVNRAWCEMLGYTEVALLGMTMQEITHPDDVAENLQAIQNVVEGHAASFRMEKRYRHQQGQLVWGYLSAALVRNASGEPLHFISQLQDVTDRKRMEDELRQERASLAERVRERTEELSRANAELARAVRLKDEFLAIMSHELRTPLNVVLGMSGALLEGGYGELNERQSGALRRVEENGRHLLDLITDILDLSEIGAGKWELNYNVFPVESVCQASIRLLNQTIRQKHLKISSTFDSAVTTMYADERRIKQVLVHLLSNAAKFTDDGGQIGLLTEGDAEHHTISFTVWDTGIGMPREGMEMLFLPFTQADSTLSRKYNGAGVGLSLVYHIVHMHGGSLLVESTVNEGSRFIVTLPWFIKAHRGPLYNDTSAYTASSRHPWELTEEHENLLENSLVSQAPPHISPTQERDLKQEGDLVVLTDDHEQTLKQLSEDFNIRGWRVAVTRNGEEALACMREDQPALCILGGHLPNTNTGQFIRNVRAQYPVLLMIMLTALELPGDRGRYLNAGLTRYLRKPLDERTLDELLQEVS